jgi:hypothetical protein
LNPQPGAPERQVSRLFLLSPARVSGARAQLLSHPGAMFPLARQFQSEGLPLADVFTFASALYFRGKITYARRFARAPEGDLIRVITSNAGLVDPLTRVTPASLAAFGAVDIREDDPRFRDPLQRDAQALSAQLKPAGVAILLGSIATAKYRDVLLTAFGPRLVFPADFVGRGDMSRGGLLLRCARAGTELAYVPVAGASTRGRRAPRLGPP